MTTLSTGIEVATLAAVPGLGDPDGFNMVMVGGVAGVGGYVVGGGVYNTLPGMFNTMEVSDEKPTVNSGNEVANLGSGDLVLDGVGTGGGPGSLSSSTCALGSFWPYSSGRSWDSLWTSLGLLAVCTGSVYLGGSC